MTQVAADDSSWRVGAVFRACVRYGMERQAAVEGLTPALGADGARQLADIWFRREPVFVTREDEAAYRSLAYAEDRDALVVRWRQSVVECARAAHRQALAGKLEDGAPGPNESESESGPGF